MLKKFFKKVLSGQGSKEQRIQLRVIPRDSHGISRKNISPNAVRVLYRLNEAGYDAYLVGGGVRDLLLGAHPKDFDVATNATPEQVKQVFRNCRLIGRRFRLAHVHFGREIIEVATFRSGHDKADEGSASTSDEGLILRDNVYGNQQEDALRRDFTVNALYYNVKDFSIHDYAHGLADIQHRVIRLIGDPETRYREDPVRMLRAIRFAAKLGFSIAPDTATPIRELKSLLESIPPARLFDETLKLLMSGQGNTTFKLLHEYGLLLYLIPAAARYADHSSSASSLFELALQSTDTRIAEEKPVTPAFLYAAFLWPAVQERQAQFEKDGMPPMQALHVAASELIDEQVKFASLPKRFSIPVKEMWELQLRLARKQGKRSIALLSHPRFRAAYDLLLLREQAGDLPANQSLGNWWTELQRKHPVSPQSQESAEAPTESGETRRPRRRRPPRKRRAPSS